MMLFSYWLIVLFKAVFKRVAQCICWYARNLRDFNSGSRTKGESHVTIINGNYAELRSFYQYTPPSFLCLLHHHVPDPNPIIRTRLNTKTLRLVCFEHFLFLFLLKIENNEKNMFGWILENVFKEIIFQKWVQNWKKKKKTRFLCFHLQSLRIEMTENAVALQGLFLLRRVNGGRRWMAELNRWTLLLWWVPHQNTKRLCCASSILLRVHLSVSASGLFALLSTWKKHYNNIIILLFLLNNSIIIL